MIQRCFPTQYPLRWYLGLGAVVFSMVASHTWNQRWQGDFWQHSACIQEISAHPFSPGHPHLAVNQPHEFYSPYTVALGWTCRILGINSIALLSAMGIVNLCLFLAALWHYVRSLSAAPAAPFYALLFTLMLWGPPPMMFSGFPHLQALSDIVRYPSFFSAFVTLLAWWLYLRITRGGSPLLFAPLGLMLGFVLLTHPPTAVALNLGLAALWFGTGRKSLRHTVMLAAALMSQLAIAWLWPYYPFFEVALNAPATHHLADKWCYTKLHWRYWPLALCLPALATRARRNWRDPLVVSCLGCLVVFGAGYVTGKYAFGRTVAYVMFFAHVAAADWVSAPDTAPGRILQGTVQWQLAAKWLLLAVTLVLSIYYLGVGIYRYRPGRPSTYRELVFLRQPIYQGKVVLADLATATFVPSFGPKVVAVDVYQRFVPDHPQRQHDVQAFFSDADDETDRRMMLQKYHVDFILVNSRPEPLQKEVMSDLLRLGDVVYEKGGLTMIAVPKTGNGL